MSDNKQLEQQLWNIANTLRGKMDADEFRDYILGFIFYKYLSEKIRLLADKLLSEDNIKYIDVNENTSDGKELLERETLLIRKKTVKRVIEKIMSFIETFVDDLAA